MTQRLLLRTIGVLAILLSLNTSDVFSAQDSPGGQEIGSANWGATARKKVSDVPWTKADIGAFLDKIIDNGGLNANVGDFRFLDLDGDGLMELIATVDFSGRGFFNTLYVVRQEKKGFRLQEIKTWNMSSLTEAVADIDGDGLMELIVKQPLIPYLGALPQATWRAVYALGKSEYEDRSASFASYYQTHALLQVEKRALSPDDEEGGFSSDVAQIEFDKVMRVTGQNPRAGLGLALAWAQDGSPVRRIFAAAVLKEIDDPLAAESIERLTHDPDDSVAANAALAQDALQRSRERRKQ